MVKYEMYILTCITVMDEEQETEEAHSALSIIMTGRLLITY